MTEQIVNEILDDVTGVLVGNLTGVFAVALQVAHQQNGRSIAIVDETMQSLTIPDSTEVQIVEKTQKHQVLAEIARAGVIIGGGPGTIKLANAFIEHHKPLVAIAGSGGVVDEGVLPQKISVVESVTAAMELL